VYDTKETFLFSMGARRAGAWCAGFGARRLWVFAHLYAPLGSPVYRPFLDCWCCGRSELAGASYVTGRVDVDVVVEVGVGVGGVGGG
jgi:hypothetical protein